MASLWEAMGEEDAQGYTHLAFFVFFLFFVFFFVF